MGEAGFFYKRMPSRTFIIKDEVKDPGLNAQTDHVAWIECGNCLDFMVKPGLLYKARIQSILKNKKLLSVF